MKRRTLLNLFVAGGGMLVSGIVAIPALLTGLSPALQPSRRESWRPIGPLNEVPIGTVQDGAIVAEPDSWPRTLPGKSVFIWRPSAEELVVFSRSCTDLGCPLDHEAGSGCYFCPCHGGIFAPDGERLAGPPNRPMDRYAHRVRDGVLEIDVSSLPPGV